MNTYDNLIDIKDLFGCLWGELDMLELMVLGLAQAKDPYTKGFGMVCSYFRETMSEIQKNLEEVPLD